MMELFSGVTQACRAATPELVRRTSVALLGVARNYTPPNPGGSKDPGAAPVKKLRERIRENIIGGREPMTAVPSNEKDGARPLDVRGTQGWGYFGFVVPRGSTRGRKLRYESPEAVLSGRRWKRRKNYHMAVRDGEWAFHWVRRGELMAWVKKRQTRAGALLSAWLRAAEQVAMSNTAAFRRAKDSSTAVGGASFRAAGHRFRFYACAEPRYGARSRVWQRYMRRFNYWLPRYATGAVKNVQHWYLKSLGFNKTGLEQTATGRQMTRQRKAWDAEKMKNLRAKVRK